MPDIKTINRKLDDQIEQATSRDGIPPAVLTLSDDEIVKFREFHSAPTGQLLYSGVPIDDPLDALLADVDATDAITPRGFVPARAAGIESGQLESDNQPDDDNIYVSPLDVEKASKFSKAPDVGKTGPVKVQK